MKERLTDERISSFNAAPEGKRLDVFDTQLPGLVLRITDKGVKSFAIRYRHNGRTQRYTIGKTPPLKLKKAREIAYGLLASARQGQNPMAEKREARKARAVSTPVEKAVECYLEKGLTTPKEAHRKEVARLLRKEVAGPWKGRGIASIENSDVAKLLDNIEAPSTKRFVYFYLRSFFKWCKGRYIKVFPIDPDFISPAKGGKRDRVLDSAELKAIWIEVTSTYSTYNAIIQLLILTGQRRDEIAEAEWNEFDFAKKIWTLPAERTKEGKKSSPLAPQPACHSRTSKYPPHRLALSFPERGQRAGYFFRLVKRQKTLRRKIKNDQLDTARSSAHSIDDARCEVTHLPSRHRVYHRPRGRRAKRRWGNLQSRQIRERTARRARQVG
jgi:integrase